MKTTLDSRNAIRTILSDELKRRQQSNSRYSIRAFAKALGMSSSALSEVIRGKRTISRKQADKLLVKLAYPDAERERVLALFQNLGKSKLESQPRVTLTTEEFANISAWEHFAILSLIETRNFRSDPRWIASRLGISVETAAGTIENLIRHGFVEAGAGGALLLTGRQFSSPEGSSCEHARTAHKAQLHQAAAILDEVSHELREFSSMIMAIDPARLPKAKELLKKFRRRFCRYLEAGKKIEVYTLSMQLYPNTQHPPKELT